MTITLPIHGIEITLGKPRQDRVGFEGGSIRSDLKQPCTHCGQPDCHHDRDGSQGADEPNERDDGRAEFNAAIDGMGSLILALACEGVNLETHPMIDAINTAVESISNHLGE